MCNLELPENGRMLGELISLGFKINHLGYYQSQTAEVNLNLVLQCQLETSPIWFGSEVVWC